MNEHITTTQNKCPECDGPAEVWADASGGITVNFACDNPACGSGKAPWDTPRPETAIILGRPVKSRAGNVIANAGLHRVTGPGMSPGFVFIETPEHYAGVGVSSVPVRRCDRISNGYGFVGRSRSTEPGTPGAIRERRVRLPDGSVTWAEEGSLTWDRAAKGA